MRPSWALSRLMPVTGPDTLGRVLTINQPKAYTSSAVKTKSPPSHSSLESFIHHASLQKMDVESTVFRGTMYEYTVLQALTQIRFDLYRTGGADDKGIDLRGTWRLLDEDDDDDDDEDREIANHAIPVVCQCKNEAKKIGPKHVRELCGIARSRDTLLVLASASHYTEKALQTCMASKDPVCLLVVDRFDDGGGLRQIVWNVAARGMLEGLEVRSVHDAATVALKLYYRDKLLKAPRKTTMTRKKKKKKQ